MTELIIAELLFLQHQDRAKPIYLYINSTGTTRADGETVGFETEGTVRIDTEVAHLHLLRHALTLCFPFSPGYL